MNLLNELNKLSTLVKVLLVYFAVEFMLFYEFIFISFKLY